MSLPVGIHENLTFSKAEKNEKGTLVVAFKKLAQTDFAAALNSGSASAGLSPSEQDFLIFPPRLENMNNETDTFENVMKKIVDIVDPLSHILSVYMQIDDIKKGWDILKDTGLTNENMRTRIMSEAMLTKVYNNIVNQFLVMAKPIVEDPNQEKVRMIFIRKSSASHFPALRKRFLDSNPFIERMSVPVSKLKFSDFEIKNKLNDGTAVPKPVASGNGQDTEILFETSK